MNYISITEYLYQKYEISHRCFHIPGLYAQFVIRW